MLSQKNNLINKIIASQNRRAKKDINSWRNALNLAENADNPKRNLLYNLYEELVLDAHLSSEKQKRILSVRGCPFSLYEKSSQQPNTEKTQLLKRTWFYSFLDIALDTFFWSHSLIQLGEIVDNEISEIKLVDRRHVIPEKGLFVYEQNEEKGIFYRDDESYSNWLVEIGDSRNLGILNKTAPHVLYKRFATSAWSEFCELFGMPLRVAKTNVKDNKSLDRMEEMMIQTAVAGYLIVDNEEEIEFVKNEGGSGEVYSRLIAHCNAEISKLVNGAVIGEASQGGSRSKEEVGERTGSMITEADKIMIEGYVNNLLFPKLIKHGYPLEGVYFGFEKNKDLESLWKMTEGLLAYKKVDNDFITSTFGIPVEDKPETETADQLSTQLKHKKEQNPSFDPFG